MDICSLCLSSMHCPISWKQYPNFEGENHPIPLSMWFEWSLPSPCYSDRHVASTASIPLSTGKTSDLGWTFDRTMRKSCALYIGIAQLLECQPELLMDIFAITWGDPSWKESQQLKQQCQKIERDRFLMASLGLLDPAKPKAEASPKLLRTTDHDIAFWYIPVSGGSLKPKEPWPIHEISWIPWNSMQTFRKYAEVYFPRERISIHNEFLN